MPIMKQSRLPDDWVARAVASAPFTKISDNNFRTCPGRFAFEFINEPNTKQMGNNGQQVDRAEPQYEITWLGPPGAQEQINTVLWPEVYGLMKQKWPSRFTPQGAPIGLHTPWRDQGERVSRKTGQLHNGMTPGLPLMRFISKYKPQVVDAQMNPIVDKKRLYAGVWGVVLFNLFDFDNLKSGIGLGVQGLMLVADDMTLEGGGPDVKAAFAGVQVEARFDAAASFGAQTAGGVPPAPGAFMPPPQPVAAPPAGIVAMPPLPASATVNMVPAPAFDLNKALGF